MYFVIFFSVFLSIACLISHCFLSHSFFYHQGRFMESKFFLPTTNASIVGPKRVKGLLLPMHLQVAYKSRSTYIVI